MVIPTTSVTARIAGSTGATTAGSRFTLGEELKRLGFIRGCQVVLYGLKLELVGDPIVMANNLVVVDAIEKKSGLLRRVRIPSTILRQGRGNRKVA